MTGREHGVRRTELKINIDIAVGFSEGIISNNICRKEN